jgi:hypothetical protein
MDYYQLPTPAKALMFIRNQAVLCLLLMCLTGCGIANNLRLRQANDDLQPQWNSREQIAQLQAEFIGYKPYIRVRVNDSTELKLLVDTGASFSLLWDTAPVRQLQLRQGYPLEVGGFGQQQDSAAFQTELASVAVGPALFEKVQVAVIPMAGTGYFLKPEEATYDGVMGHDLIRHFSWVFDRSSGQISLSSQPYQAAKHEQLQPFEISWHKVVVHSSLQLNSQTRIDQELLLDTGSRHYLKINQAYLENNNIQLDGKLRQGADFGMSGRHANQRGKIGELKFGGQTLAAVPANVLPADDEDDWWLVGSGVLMQHRLVLDYLSQRWLLQPLPRQPFQARLNLTGLELRKLTNGRFIVRDNLNPALQGWLQAGDEVSHINGIAAESISKLLWLDLSSKAGSLTLCRAAADCRSILLSAD